VVPLPRRPGRRSHPRPDDGGTAEPGPAAAALGELVARIADESGFGGAGPVGDAGAAGDRGAQLRALAGALGRAARDAGRSAGGGVRGLGRLLADVVADAAPRIRVRDAGILRMHHPGRTDEEIAEALVRAAARSTAAFGAGVGGLAAVEFAAPLLLVAAPLQLAAETVAVAAVEVKLVAELHELFGQPAYGTGSQRGAAYLTSWGQQRAVDPLAGRNGLSTVLGYAAKRELQTILVRRMGRGVGKLAPFLAGAVAGAEINRRATRSLGATLTAQLRDRRRSAPP
jgi:hypothetical protein